MELVELKISPRNIDHKTMIFQYLCLKLNFRMDFYYIIYNKTCCLKMLFYIEKKVLLAEQILVVLLVHQSNVLQ